MQLREHGSTTSHKPISLDGVTQPVWLTDELGSSVDRSAHGEPVEDVFDLQIFIPFHRLHFKNEKEKNDNNIQTKQQVILLSQLQKKKRRDERRRRRRRKTKTEWMFMALPQSRSILKHVEVEKTAKQEIICRLIESFCEIRNKKIFISYHM